MSLLLGVGWGAYAWDKNTSARVCAKNAVGGLCTRGGGGICGTLRFWHYICYIIADVSTTLNQGLWKATHHITASDSDPSKRLKIHRPFITLSYHLLLFSSCFRFDGRIWEEPIHSWWRRWTGGTVCQHYSAKTTGHWYCYLQPHCGDTGWQCRYSIANKTKMLSKLLPHKY